MATSTYDLLDTITLSSAQAEVTFSSIDQSYADLILVATNVKTSVNTSYHSLRFNGSTSGYNRVSLAGRGSSPQSSWDYGANAIALAVYAAINTSSDSASVTQIFDYTATDKFKHILHREGNLTPATYAVTGCWENTAAITSITYRVFSNSLAAGLKLDLYGVVA